MITPSHLQVLITVLQRATHAGIVGLAEQMVVKEMLHDLEAQVAAAQPVEQPSVQEETTP